MTNPSNLATGQGAMELPPGQFEIEEFPRFGLTPYAYRFPSDTSSVRLEIGGDVAHPLTVSEELGQLTRCHQTSDFHCVTAWSRLGNLWEGVSVGHLLDNVGVQQASRFALIEACDEGWTTNLPLSALLHEDVLLADRHDSEPINDDHGGPVRLIVPRLFAWKSAKWIKRITLSPDNMPGYWEQLGYHNVGDPGQNQRYRDDPEWMVTK